MYSSQSPAYLLDGGGGTEWKLFKELLKLFTNFKNNMSKSWGAFPEFYFQMFENY